MPPIINKERIDFNKKSINDDKTNTTTTNKNTIEDNEDKESNVSIKLNLTEILTEVIKVLIAEHFWGSTIILSIGSVIYLAYKYDINLLSVFNISEIFSSGNSLSVLMLILILLSLGIAIFIANKVMNVVNNNDMSYSINKIMMDECKEIKLEISNLTKILSSLQIMQDELSKSIQSLINTLDNDSLNNTQIKKCLSDINNILQNVPNKDSIIKMLLIRTRLIYNDLSSSIFDYINSYKIYTSSTEYSEISKGRFSYAEEKLLRDFSNTKELYISDVYAYSKNTFNNDSEDKLISILDDAFENIKGLVLSNNETTEELFLKIRDIINLLVIKSESIFKNNLKLVSLFTENQ